MTSVDRPVTRESRESERGAGATKAAILDAARQRLLADGYARLSTRSVAEAAGVPLSQLHYHFGSKQRLILELLAAESDRLLVRQSRMFGSDQPLWRRYEQSCDFLEDDLDSGFVRVLQEMVAAGWSDPVIGQRVIALLEGWRDVIAGAAREAEARFGPLGPFTVDEVVALIGQAFLGAEALLLLGVEREDWPVRSSLRRLGQVIRALEETAGA